MAATPQPLHALKACEGARVSVMLKSGRCAEGTLEEMDRFMNMRLRTPGAMLLVRGSQVQSIELVG